jgi:hypothetical protein
MFIDPKRITPKFRAARDALAALDADQQDAVIAQTLARRWEPWADNRYGRKNLTAAKWWGWLRRKTGSDLDRCLAKHGYVDHAEIRQAADGSRYFISHPYGLDQSDLETLLRLCEANNLRCSIGASSWYFPGHTVVVVVQTQEQFSAKLQERPRRVADDYLMSTPPV